MRGAGIKLLYMKYIFFFLESVKYCYIITRFSYHIKKKMTLIKSLVTQLVGKIE